MKNIISAAIIATVATVGTMASADITTKGLVFRDGQEIGTIYDVKVMDGTSPEVAAEEVEAMYADLDLKSKKENATRKSGERRAAINFLKAVINTGELTAEEVKEVQEVIAGIELAQERATKY